MFLPLRAAKAPYLSWGGWKISWISKKHVERLRLSTHETGGESRLALAAIFHLWIISRTCSSTLPLRRGAAALGFSGQPYRQEQRLLLMFLVYFYCRFSPHHVIAISSFNELNLSRLHNYYLRFILWLVSHGLWLPVWVSSLASGAK